MNIFSYGFMSLASILITVACLLLMGSSLLIAVNADNIIDTLESENEIVAYIDENYSTEEAKALEPDFLDLDNVNSVVFVSRDQAFDDFKDQFSNSTFLSDLDSSILRDRYVIYLDDISLMEDTLNQVRGIQGVAEASGHLEIAEGFATLRNVVSAVSILLVAVLLVISLFIMSNTIKLTTFERREEIAIMKMVGATNNYIKFPFVVEGMLLGFVGALAAYIAQWGLYMLIGEKVVESAQLGFLSLVSFADLAIPLLLLFIVMGLGVGIVGSLMAIKKFLKV
jgi:cell division transport system permease protein